MRTSRILLPDDIAPSPRTPTSPRSAPVPAAGSRSESSRRRAVQHGGAGVIDDTKAAAADLLLWATDHLELPWQSITLSVKLANGVTVGIKVGGGPP